MPRAAAIRIFRSASRESPSFFLIKTSIRIAYPLSAGTRAPFPDVRIFDAYGTRVESDTRKGRALACNRGSARDDGLKVGRQVDGYTGACWALGISWIFRFIEGINFRSLRISSLKADGYFFF